MDFKWQGIYSTLLVLMTFCQSPEVRKATLEALHPLYADTELRIQLDNFSQRFKERFMEMTADKDVQVGVEAIKLATALYKYD